MYSCSVTECPNPAASWVRFRGMAEHAHVCPEHEAIDREFADVVASGPANDGHFCTPELFTAAPPEL